jgi:hypothetical protein
VPLGAIVGDNVGIAAAWLAGINRMPWPVFLFWNALRGRAWGEGPSTSQAPPAHSRLGAASWLTGRSSSAHPAGLAVLLGCVIAACRRFQPGMNARREAL